MPRIEEMFAFVAEEDGPDNEGVVAALFGRTWLPLVGADMERIASLRPMAQQVAKITGQKIKLLRFSVREELETIE